MCTTPKAVITYLRSLGCIESSIITHILYLSTRVHNVCANDEEFFPSMELLASCDCC